MADESTDYSNVLSRRRFVELTGVTGAAALAGCDGDSTEGPGGTDPEPTDSTGTPTDEIHDVEHRSGTTVVPSDVQFNLDNAEGAPQISQDLLFEPLAQYYYLDAAYEPGAIADWNYTGDTLELEVREGLVWSNGDDVTADDLVRQFRVYEATSHPMWSWASDVEATGDYSVTVTVGDSVNPALIEFDVFEDFLRCPADPYDDLLAADDPEAALSSERIDDPITNGPFTFVEKDDQSLQTELFEDHPDAGGINFRNYSFNIVGGASNEARQQALLSGEIDSEFSLAAPARIVADLPAHVREVRPPSKWGFGLAPNHDHAHTGDRAVRQAIEYVINRDEARLDSLPRAKQTVPIPTGITSDEQEAWLGDVWDDFEDYGPEERKTDEATAVLEDAGYAQVDGTWEDSDGNVVALPIAVPGGWSDWVLAAETCVAHLNAFGFESQIDSVAAGNYFPRLGESDFTLIANGSFAGAPRGAYPYYSLLHQLHDPQVHAVKSNYPGHDDSSFLQGQNADITVPAMDGSGDLTVNPGERLDDLAQATDDSEIEEIVVELAWVANQDLPHLPILEKLEQSFYSAGAGSNWDAPTNPQEDPDAVVQWPNVWLPRKGKFNYVE